MWVRVEDPSGATIPDAQIIVLSGSDVLGEVQADSKGLALIKLCAGPGELKLDRVGRRALPPPSRTSRFRHAANRRR